MKKLLVLLASALLMCSCLTQIALNYPLRRDLKKDTTSYNGAIARMRGWTARLGNAAPALRDTFIVSQHNGAKLHGVYQWASQPTRHTAVILHGYGGNLTSMLSMAHFFKDELGYNVLLPDFYAHGLSEGKMRQMGWLDRFDMLQWMCVADSIFSVGQTDSQGNRLPVGSTQMVLIGVSMGGATTMMTSGEVEQRGMSFVKCFVEDCGYTSVWDQFSSVMKGRFKGIMKMGSRRCRKKYGWDFKEASSVEQVKKCHLPMLFIHGGHDTYVPTSMVHEVYAAKPEPKEIWIPEGIEHAQSFHRCNAEYRQRVKEFLSKYMP